MVSIKAGFAAGYNLNPPCPAAGFALICARYGKLILFTRSATAAAATTTGHYAITAGEAAPELGLDYFLPHFDRGAGNQPDRERGAVVHALAGRRF